MAKVVIGEFYCIPVSVSFRFSGCFFAFFVVFSSDLGI